MAFNPAKVPLRPVKPLVKRRPGNEIAKDDPLAGLSDIDGFGEPGSRGSLSVPNSTESVGYNIRQSAVSEPNEAKLPKRKQTFQNVSDPLAGLEDLVGSNNASGNDGEKTIPTIAQRKLSFLQPKKALPSPPGVKMNSPLSMPKGMPYLPPPVRKELPKTPVAPNIPPTIAASPGKAPFPPTATGQFAPPPPPIGATGSGSLPPPPSFAVPPSAIPPEMFSSPPPVIAASPVSTGAPPPVVTRGPPSAVSPKIPHPFMASPAKSNIPPPVVAGSPPPVNTRGPPPSDIPPPVATNTPPVSTVPQIAASSRPGIDESAPVKRSSSFAQAFSALAGAQQLSQSRLPPSSNTPQFPKSGLSQAVAASGAIRKASKLFQAFAAPPPPGPPPPDENSGSSSDESDVIEQPKPVSDVVQRAPETKPVAAVQATVSAPNIGKPEIQPRTNVGRRRAPHVQNQIFEVNVKNRCSTETKIDTVAGRVRTREVSASPTRTFSRVGSFSCRYKSLPASSRRSVSVMPKEANGINDKQAQREVLAWAKLGRMKGPRHLFTLNEYEEQMYIYGGRTMQGKYFQDLVRFDIDSRSFVEVKKNGTNCPPPRHSHSSCVSKTSLYVFGGIHATHNKVLSDMWHYDFVSGTWEEIEMHNNIPVGKSGCSLTASEDQLYAFGGIDEGGRCTNGLSQFDTNTMAWREVQVSGELPPTVQYHCAVVTGQSLIVFGGNGGSAYAVSPCFHEYSFPTKEWRRIESNNMVHWRTMHTGHLYGHSLAVFGGRLLNENGTPGELTNELMVYDPELNDWTVILPKTSQPGCIGPRYAHSSLMNRDTLHVMGGVGENASEHIDIRQYVIKMSEAKFEKIPRKHWQALAMKKHPAILSLRERLLPLSQQTSYARARYSRRGVASTEVRDSLKSETVLKMIRDHLDQAGLTRSCKTLEEEASIPFILHENVKKRRTPLTSLLLMSIRDTKRIFEDQKATEEDLQSGDPRDENEVACYTPFQPQDRDLAANVDSTDVWDEPKSNVIYTAEVLASGRARPFVEAASLNNLITKLASEKEFDSQFVRQFLLTFPTFASPDVILPKLIQRYHVPWTMHSHIPSEVFIQQIQRPIQQRVCAVLRFWLEKTPETLTEKLLTQINGFIDNTLVRDGHVALSKQLRNLVSQCREKASMSDEDKLKVLAQNAQYRDLPPEVKVPITIFSKELRLIDVDEEEIARQITILDFDNYASISANELVETPWMSRKTNYKSRHIMVMLKRRLQLTSWVAKSVLSASDHKQRGKLAEKYIRLAQYLIQLKNFHSMEAVVNGLTHDVIEISGALDGYNSQTLNELATLCSPNNEYSAYYKFAASCGSPCVPLLLAFLKDLIAIEETFPDTVLKNFVNFNKKRLIAEIISNLTVFQSTPFNLHPVYQISSLIQSLPPVDGITLMKLGAAILEGKHTDQNS